MLDSKIAAPALIVFPYFSTVAHRHFVVCQMSCCSKCTRTVHITGIYLLQIYSTCFGCPSHPTSGVHKTVTAAYGTGHIT